MANSNSRIMMLFSIITRGKAAKYMKTLNEKGIAFHFQTTAFGTAPSEMMDIFGLGTNDKDIVISLAPENVIDSYLIDANRSLGGNYEYGGLMICLRLSAISRITSELVARASGDKKIEGGRKKVKDTQKHQLIIVSVNQGYTDMVMETAKLSGAMGGTVLRARLVESGMMEQLGDSVQAEREIIAIFAPVGSASKIMESINKEHGVTSEANGIVMALPVDKAYKI